MVSLISIIIPTYNRYQLIGETLDSIISQSFVSWECIVVDDRSVDYTKELLSFYCEKDSRIMYFSLPEDSIKGANSCRNFGFQKSRGLYINWFDSDDIMCSSYLQKQISSIRGSKCSICNSGIFRKSIKDVYFTLDNQSSSESVLIDYITGKINLGVHSTLWKRGAVKNYNYDEDLEWAQELDFFFRVFKENNYKVSFLNETLVYLRRHSDSLTGNYSNFNLSCIFSELVVRRRILSYIYLNGLKEEILEKALELYFKGFKMLFLRMEIGNIKKEIKELKRIFRLDLRIIFWETNMFLILICLFLKYRRIDVQSRFKNFQDYIKA